MKDNTNSKEFWNNYVTYWENKAQEANNCEDAKDKTAGDVVYEEYFNKLNVKAGERFLDFGCGFGRLYPIYKRNTGTVTDCKGYYGIDVSGLTLEHAAQNYSDLKIGESLIEFDGLNIPFDEDFFDKVMCYGVFDATNQEKIIRELFRVTKVDGVIMLNGKNNNYDVKDDAAMIAEINARKKGHPNSFTDVHKLIEIFEAYGIEVCDSYYFVHRKDFAENTYVKEIPDVFYQWTLILKKGKKYVDREYSAFSDKYSLTYQMKHREER